MKADHFTKINEKRTTILRSPYQHASSPVSPTGAAAKSSVPLCRREKSIRCTCHIIADSRLCCGTVPNGIGSCQGEPCPMHPQNSPPYTRSRRRENMFWAGGVPTKTPLRESGSRSRPGWWPIPSVSLGDIFRELQRLSPGRYQPLHVRTLQRGMRKIRAHLLETFKEQWQEEVIRGPSLSPISARCSTSISRPLPIEQTPKLDFLEAMHLYIL